ncbi:hypothetical protein [Thiohalobacter sp. COW1]|uniref:hypothetical protein n=1 Tax=Thiohalobacter sp. COW1 TaxID=2795687 RepID=UPI001915F502|nr:hypothetical protein [Thiohalobacter sp. COW1]
MSPQKKPFQFVDNQYGQFSQGLWLMLFGLFAVFYQMLHISTHRMLESLDLFLLWLISITFLAVLSLVGCVFFYNCIHVARKIEWHGGGKIIVWRFLVGKNLFRSVFYDNEVDRVEKIHVFGFKGVITPLVSKNENYCVRFVGGDYFYVSGAMSDVGDLVFLFKNEKRAKNGGSEKQGQI